MEDCIYRDPRAPVEARVKDLLSRMTLQEKLGQMTQIERSVATPSVLRDLSIGSILSVGGSCPFENALSKDWADMIDGFQRAALESRLGIPLIYGVDAVHGNNNVYGATIFPHNIGLGATRDDELARKIGVATALEVRASGSPYTFAPSVAVCKDPRWGRCYESFSEDTEIVRKMASVITGLQGQPPPGHPSGYPFLAGRNNVIACAKHFVGDGGTHEGRNEGNTILSYEDLERIHLAPYLDCLSQGVCTIMASYSSWNGTQMHTSKFLLTDVLKGKLGFKGFIITDCAALDRLSNPFGSNYRRCVLAAINAGIDMVMVPLRYQLYLDDLKCLVESGEIPMTRIDDAVERILRVKFIAGLFEYPLSDRSLLDKVGCKLHRDLAREAVRKSLVLLKNGKDTTKPFLPLDKNAKRILVAGQHADDLGFQCGGWTKTWDGQSGRITIGTTILDAIRASVGGETEVVYEQNPSLDTFSNQQFSFSIVIVGEAPYCESGGDSKDLIIPFNGSKLISFVADRVPTLAILISGRPMYLEPSLLDKVDGFVAAWLPGTEGAGVTDAKKVLQSISRFQEISKNHFFAYCMIFRRLLGFMMGCFGCAGQPTEPKIESKAVVDDQPVVTSPRVRLSDGRFLAYRERGVPKTKSSYRIIIVHGFGSSKDMSFMASDELLDELGVYLLIYDRAGYGESDHNPKRTLKSEASDIEELADLMQLGPKYYVIGVSLGCYPAWSCLKRIPNRLAGVALVVPFVNYKWRSLPDNLTRDDYRKQLCQWVIWITRHARGLLHWWLTQTIFPSASVLDQNPQFFCEKDLEVLKNTPGYQLFTQDGLRSRKVFDSLCRDCNVAFGKWDFDPLELSNPYPKNESSVHIWQGYKDKVVPVELQRHVWERLPWIRYHEVPDGGHLLVYDTAVCEAILRSLLLGEDPLLYRPKLDS